MLKFKEFIAETKKSTGDLKNACWKGYTAIGTKKKNGKTVPNCVPEEYISEEQQEYLNRPELEAHIGKGGMSSIMKHSFFKKHIVGTGTEPKFRHSTLSDYRSQVDAISTPHRYVTFEMLGYGKRKKAVNAHMFTWDGKSRTPRGAKFWVHHSSQFEDKEYYYAIQIKTNKTEVVHERSYYRKYTTQNNPVFFLGSLYCFYFVNLYICL